MSEDIEKVTIVTAWAKRSGLARISERVSKFRDRGGILEIILGVSEGGATQEGLELALEIADSVQVFHDPRRTFHPKVYLATGAIRRELFVGSSNLTAGGLSWNFESSLWVSALVDEQLDVFEEVEAWLALIRSEAAPIRSLGPGLLEALIDSRTIAIGRETGFRTNRSKVESIPEDSDSAPMSSPTDLFGKSAFDLRQLRQLPERFKLTQIETNVGLPEVLAKKSSERLMLPEISEPEVLMRWTRIMDNTAAQKVKSAGSHATGNLRLTQAGHPIEHTAYFRNRFFADLPWTSSETKPLETEVDVAFSCYIGNEFVGDQILRVSHNPNRIAGQANVPTVLQWGRHLGLTLRSGDFVDKYVSLERLKNGTFRLIVADEPSGDFIA